MDTWATSSLTPQLAGGWGSDDELFLWYSPTTCARKDRTSFAPGCSRPCCAQSWNTGRSPGKTPEYPASLSTLIARRCRNRKGTSSHPNRCWTNTAPTRCATGPPLLASGQTPPLIRKTRNRSKLVAGSPLRFSTPPSLSIALKAHLVKSRTPRPRHGERAGPRDYRGHGSL